MKNTLKKIAFAGATAALILGSVSVASAGPLSGVSGAVKFVYDGFDAAQTQYDYTSVDASGVLCDNTMVGNECNAAANLVGGPAAPGANGTDDTWGVASVTSIKPDTNAPGANFWGAGENGGEYLLTYFHGFEDIRVVVLDNGTPLDQSDDVVNTFSSGGLVEIYLVDLSTLQAAYAAVDQGALMTILSAPGMETYLELAFDPVCSPTITTATLCGTFDFDDFEGDSNGDAHVVGGTAADQYPNNFEFGHRVSACSDVTLDNAGNPVLLPCIADTSWNIEVHDGSATTTTIPEPASLGLLGLGLVGLGLASRRRKA